MANTSKPDYLTIPGAQVTEAEREFLKDQATDIGTAYPVIVNIGVMWGCSLWCFRRGRLDAQLYAVDIEMDRWGIHRKEDLDAVFIEGDSTEVWKDFKKHTDRPIDLLFIDGDHSYKIVRQDIAGWVPLIAPDGIVIFHDYAPKQINLRQFPHIAGVRQAVDEWRASPAGCSWTPVNAPDSLCAFAKRGC